IWVSNTGKQVYDEAGKYLGIRGSIRNIQEMMNRETAMSWQTKTLTALHETALELASKHDLQEVLQAILTRSVSLLSASRGSLFLYREETDDLILTLQENPINELKKVIIKRGEGIAGKVLEEGKPVTIDNFSVWSGEKSKREKKTLGAVAGVPIYWGERMLGVLVISESGNNDFSPEEIHLLESFAPLAAAAIEQTNLLTETSKRKHDVEVLLRAENVVVESLSLDEICTRILDQLINVIPYDSASIQLLDRNELEIAYGKGFNNLEKIIGLRFPVPGKNINTEVLNTKKPMILSNIKEKPSKYFTAPHSRIKSWMGIPLIFKGEIFGMLTVDSETPGFFTDKHLELATAFANQVTVAIKNARLYEQTKNDAETKSLLISEINHRVKNNLTAIIGLLFAELNHI
ncbi:MAG: GAF domain-containing protein, partial [Calditrichia bacterium]|nr:GAF domain-containing protein [Calditrichia bacterium]